MFFFFRFVFLVCLLPTSLPEIFAENPQNAPPLEVAHEQQQQQQIQQPPISTAAESTAGKPAAYHQNQHVHIEEQQQQQNDGQHNQQQRQETQYVHPSSKTDGEVAPPPPPPPPPASSQAQESQYAAANQNYHNYDKAAPTPAVLTGERDSVYVQQGKYTHPRYKSDVYDADIAPKQQQVYGGMDYHQNNYQQYPDRAEMQRQMEGGSPPVVGPQDHSGMRDDEGHVFDDSSVRNSDNTLIEQWEKHMQNFVPETLVTLGLNARSDEYFYEEVGADPVYIRGGYFVSGDEDQTDVDFTVTDPSGEIVYKKTQPEGLFYFYSTMAGTYSFIISNHRWMETKTVTFAIGTGNETTMHPKHLNSAEANIAAIELQLKDVRAESQYLWIRQRSHMQAVKNTEWRVFMFSVIELICLVTVSLFQIYYIKGLVSDKRIL